MQLHSEVRTWTCEFWVGHNLPHNSEQWKILVLPMLGEVSLPCPIEPNSEHLKKCRAALWGEVASAPLTGLISMFEIDPILPLPTISATLSSFPQQLCKKRGHPAWFCPSFHTLYSILLQILSRYFTVWSESYLLHCLPHSNACLDSWNTPVGVWAAIPLQWFPWGSLWSL